MTAASAIAALQISIHAPRVGGDRGWRRPGAGKRRFQSTLPVWGATPDRSLCGEAHCYFNPRSPCGGRLREHIVDIAILSISIHAPRVGGDGLRSPSGPSPLHFNPRSPCGGRLVTFVFCLISKLFQSTLPVWGATTSVRCLFVPLLFQSTLPVWGATFWGQSLSNSFSQFQSTLPVWGATL